MRLAEGFVVDMEKTFWELKFSAMRRENFEQDVEGNNTGKVLSRVYDLRSRGAGKMISVTLPAEAGKKEIPAGTVVELVNPVLGCVGEVEYPNVVGNWYLKADDIVKKSGSSGANPAAGKEKQQDMKNAANHS